MNSKRRRMSPPEEDAQPEFNLAARLAAAGPSIDSKRGREDYRNGRKMVVASKNPVNGVSGPGSMADAGAATPEYAKLSEMAHCIERFRETATCGICVRMMYEPFTIECGHSFCYDCLARWFEQDSFGDDDGSRRKRKKETCPECRVRVTKEPVPSYAIRSVVEILISQPILLHENETLETHQSNQTADKTRIQEDRSRNGLFSGRFAVRERQTGRSAALLDIEDGVMRCPSCGWELEQGECAQCGFELSPLSTEATDTWPSDSDANNIINEIGPFAVEQRSSDGSASGGSIEDFLADTLSLSDDAGDGDNSDSDDMPSMFSDSEADSMIAAGASGQRHIPRTRRNRSVPQNIDLTRSSDRHGTSPPHSNSMAASNGSSNPTARRSAQSRQAPTQRRSRRPVVISDDDDSDAGRPNGHQLNSAQLAHNDSASSLADSSADDLPINPRRRRSGGTRARVTTEASDEDGEDDEDDDSEPVRPRRHKPRAGVIPRPSASRNGDQSASTSQSQSHRAPQDRPIELD